MEEEEHAEDVYPDGPLQSGMNSLRRVKPKPKVRREGGREGLRGWEGGREGGEGREGGREGR